MKIVKKLSIGFLSLIICFCSCFKFVNAESYEIVESPFYLTNGFYELFIDDSYLGDDNTIVANSSNNGETCEILFLGQNINLLQVEGSSISLEFELTYLRDFQNSTNSINYKVYSFNFDAEDLLTSFQFNYDDTEIVYLTRLNNSSNGFSVYDTIYNLIETYIFGGNIEVGSHQDLTATTLSSIVCILVFALPFLIIWKVLKVIMG